MVRLLDRFGRIGVLVNGVGITGPTVNIERYSLAGGRVLDVNLTSTFLCCKAAIAPMRRQNAGRIVNLASIAGKRQCRHDRLLRSKGRRDRRSTKSLGKELASTNIRVNNACHRGFEALPPSDRVKQTGTMYSTDSRRQRPEGAAFEDAVVGLSRKTAATANELASISPDASQQEPAPAKLSDKP